MKGWHYKDNLLTWVDTGQQWEIDYWDDNDYEEFLAMDFGGQEGLLEQLDNLKYEGEGETE